MDQHVACINTNRLNNNTLVLSRTAVLKYKESPAKIVEVDHHISHHHLQVHALQHLSTFLHYCTSPLTNPIQRFFEFVLLFIY